MDAIDYNRCMTVNDNYGRFVRFEVRIDDRMATADLDKTQVETLQRWLERWMRERWEER